VNLGSSGKIGRPQSVAPDGKIVSRHEIRQAVDACPPPHGGVALRSSRFAKAIPDFAENAKMQRGVSCHFMFYNVL
jgi:hypothetical protein